MHSQLVVQETPEVGSSACACNWKAKEMCAGAYKWALPEAATWSVSQIATTQMFTQMFKIMHTTVLRNGNSLASTSIGIRS